MSSLANAPAIEVRDVSKRFRIYREKPTSLKQRLLTSRSRAEDFWRCATSRWTWGRARRSA